MKIKHLLTKTLLVAAGLLVGQSVWAADPDLVNDFTLVKSVTFGDGVNIAGSGACAHTAYDTGNKKQQSLTILTAPEDAAGWIAMQAWTDGSDKGWWNRSDKGLYCVNAGRSACVFGDDLTIGWLVVFECTQNASTVMSLTNGNGNPDGTFTYAASEDNKSYFCTITAETNAYVGFCGNKNNGFISKISVYKPNKAVVKTTYTIKFQDMEGNKLKDDETVEGIGGNTISLTAANKANISKDDVVYIYDNDDSAEKTIADDGSTVVIIKFHAAQNFSYTVNEVCGEKNVRITTGTSYETATIKVPYRKYNAVDGQLYKKDATSKEYNTSFTLDENNKVINLGYTAVDGVNNVVFISEGEDIEGLTPITSGNTAIRSSNSASAYAVTDTKITTLPAGKYKIHAIIYDSASKPNSNWTFKAGNADIVTFNCTTVNIAEFDSQEFVISGETDIIMAAAGSTARGLDAIYIIKTGDAPTSIPATISTTGSSFASTAIIDCSKLPDGVTAYKVSAVADSKATLTEVTEAVAPGTGLILIAGTAGSYDLPVAATGNDISATNKLVGVTVAKTVADDEAYGLKDGKFNKLSAGTIPANKAYLPATAVSAPELSIVFGGEATGIADVRGKMEDVRSDFFDLQGRKVAQPAKGLYIQNGRKVILK